MIQLPRVYPILDTVTLERCGVDPVLCAGALIEGGAEILQFRHKAFWSRDVFAQAERIADLCREAGVRFVINDRADYAAILGAALHVGQDDLPPVSARRVIGAEALLGFSTHNLAQMAAAQAEPIDYVAFGPVFGTGSKERPDPAVGTEAIRGVRELTELPLVAIGGITRATAAECWSAGADCVAVISDLIPRAPALPAIRERMSEWRQVSSTHRTLRDRTVECHQRNPR